LAVFFEAGAALVAFLPGGAALFAFFAAGAAAVWLPSVSARAFLFGGMTVVTEVLVQKVVGVFYGDGMRNVEKTTQLMIEIRRLARSEQGCR
jgi:hypothetical protein